MARLDGMCGRRYCHFCQHVKIRSSSMLGCQNQSCMRRFCRHCLLTHLGEEDVTVPNTLERDDYRVLNGQTWKCSYGCARIGDEIGAFLRNYMSFCHARSVLTVLRRRLGIVPSAGTSAVARRQSAPSHTGIARHTDTAAAALKSPLNVPGRVCQKLPHCRWSDRSVRVCRCVCIDAHQQAVALGVKPRLLPQAPSARRLPCLLPPSKIMSELACQMARADLG